MSTPEESLTSPKSVVLVIGQFQPGAHGFAFEAWEKINAVYTDNVRRDYTSKHDTVEAALGEPLLEPIQLDDKDDAGSSEFRRALYEKLRQLDVWGIVSCCTAENSSKLLQVLEPIDIPVLIALDNTVARAAVTRPNVLQLIPNNALQAQAILSKVGAPFPDGNDKIIVNVYLWPAQNEFVRDLWKALQEKSNETQNSNITLNQITVGSTLREVGANLKEQDVIVYIGYYDGLEELISLVKTEKLILSDACHERRAQDLMARNNRSYYLSKPSLDPSLYACDGYLALTKVWLESGRRSVDCPLTERLMAPALLVRSHMETLFSSYRFVGATNQSGGYIVRKVSHSVSRQDSPTNNDYSPTNYES
jgi:hypothetical protein